MSKTSIIDKINKMESSGLIKPPKFVIGNCQLLVLMGSISYGVSTDYSDKDIYGLTIPPKHIVFPHLNGEIIGFGRQTKRFEQWQEHHVKYVDDEYDFDIYNIVKYFNLCMNGNPNMVDSLFVPERCVVFKTKIGDIIRDNRKLFLSKKMWHTYKGYAFSQLRKAQHKKPEGKRKELIEKYGMDTKFMYHVVRLILQIEDVLNDGDMDLERHREHLKAVRDGRMSLLEVEKWFYDKEKQLATLYDKSSLPKYPLEEEIKNLLFMCLEEHFGSLDTCVIQPNKAIQALRDIRFIVERNEHIL